MGINAFEKLNNGGFLVGSFSGLFSWFPDHNYVGDAVSGMEFIPVAATGPPIAENAITGLVWNADGLPWIFDYSGGAKPLQHHKQFSQMPQKIIENTPISLWNLALEFHTARVYGTLFGDFYILIIPLAGLSILFIIISGYWMYRKKFRT